MVCNVGGEDYFRSEKQWNLLVHSVKTFDKAGLRIWIYDEQGYPSLGAGGLVLEKNPELESKALVYDAALDAQGKDPFTVRPAFEYTHAANNVRVLRRYPDPLIPESTKLFIQLTHEEYRRRLGDALFNKIEAFFTDEPSIIAFNMSSNPGKTLPSMQAMIDRSVKNLPMVPWPENLPELYKKEYKSDLLPNRKSLFCGDTEQDRQVRLNFWTLVGKLDCNNYYGQIQNYLKQRGASVPTIEKPDTPLRLASSGHLLAEESVLVHIACDGNKIANMMAMDLPGLDRLTSKPENRNTLSAGFPCSAAFLAGHRLVMTEISDMGDFRFSKPPIFATLDMMTASAVWQAAWGVTEFASYYRFENQGLETFKKYGDYIGRLNAVLRKAKPVRPVLVFYPLEEMTEEFRPNIIIRNQSEKCLKLVQSFNEICNRLTAKQIPFTIIDKTRIKAAQTIARGIELAGLRYDTLVIPAGSKFDCRRLKTIRADASDYAAGIERLRSGLTRLEPQSSAIVGGQFERNGRTVWLFGNMDTKNVWKGKLTCLKGKRWQMLDPATGTITDLKISKDTAPVELAPMQSFLFVEKE